MPFDFISGMIRFANRFELLEDTAPVIKNHVASQPPAAADIDEGEFYGIYVCHSKFKEDESEPWK